MDEKELHSLLFSAIQHHNDSLLDDLLDGEGGNRLLDSPGDDGNMLLHAAVIENDLRCVNRLLEKGANPNVFDTVRARTPLHLAVELNQSEIVKAFLELEHINLDIRDDRNLTCYEIAQFCDNQNLANLIKTRQNDIEQLKNDFYSIMNQACSNNEPKLVRELLSRYEKRFIDKLPKKWNLNKDKKIFALASIKELINWSSSSWNDVTLLFKSASKGQTEICRLLIEYGATAKCNENTNYSPLYVAAYGGYTDTVKLLLDSFPSLVREVTIEKWTVLHACCLQGHSETAKLILTYPYSDELKNRYVSRSGVYEYYFAFDLNAQDAAGQTVIYLAVTANNEKLLDILLQFNVEAKLLQLSDQHLDNSAGHSKNQHFKDDSQKLSSNHSSNKHVRIIPDRPKLDTSVTVAATSNQLEKIIRQLQKLDTKDANQAKCDSKTTSEVRKYLICPFEMDTYCDYNSKTALHLAVCQQYHSIATTLLVNGSNPNLPILSRDTIKNDFTTSSTDTGLNWLRSSKSTCLKEACRLNDETMCEILIRYGASDNQDNLALKVAASNKNSHLISKFLSLKSNIDPEYKINKKCNVEFASRYKQGQKLSKSTYGNATTTFSSMFPSSPIMIDWQNLKCLKKLDPQWFIDASMMHNKRLKHSTTSLIAITRLDLSSNNLKQVHPVIFRLPSLRELNLSNNRLECLMDFNQRGSIEGDSTTKLIESYRTAMKRSKSANISSIGLESSNIIDLNEPQEWDLPYLETLDLHDNRLISLPDYLFELPRLSELDVSSNQIRQLPWSMWTAPCLRELIASGNLLDDLPKLPQQKSCASPNLRLGLTESPDEKSSLTSQQSVSLDKGDSLFLSSTGSDFDNQNDQSCVNNLGPSEVTTIQLESLTLQLDHLNQWKKKIDLVNDVTSVLQQNSQNEENINEQEEKRGFSKLTYLNLSYNSFATIPPVLVCLATEMTRLNLSHNRLTSLGTINSYPIKLKSLDLSNNQISSWFATDQMDAQLDSRHCFAETQLRRDTIVSKFLYGHSGTGCPHKMENRLDSLRSINLSHNSLKNIQLTLDPNLDLNQEHRSSSNKDIQQVRDHLIYPNITALDISFNKIQNVPKTISELKDLSVLNLSGNVSITSLPAELGLASKLWNLGINGCSLNEPLKSIVESKTYKTMDIIGYLRSILEEAKPYARMKLMLVGLQGIGKTSLLEQMRQEGNSGLRRKAPEHWTKRMGHTSKSNIRNQRGVTLSTVGVDIHDWVFCKRTPRNQPSFGPVSFSTWDFGGQQEFYATHRYFLSRRSMYLVVWRLTDGINGILGIQQWLVNIQSRASGSPVIIVGTHEDMVEGGEQGELVRQLQAEVYRRFLNVSDHDKCGLPRVVDSIVVSTKTKLNIKHLCNRIYDVVFSLKCPGSNERLLEQKIPAAYLYLEEIINWIVHDRQQKRREPVLTYNEYRRVTSEQLKLKYNKVFRDLEPLNSREINYNSELQQATRFLHENGILLHYEDANLRDLYFLDPQWLCDILSHVVTIREINPHVKNGLMRISDLGFLFKSIDVYLSGGIQSYVVNLLNKFEVALTWNSQYLLIPSLLPSKPSEITPESQQEFQLKVAPKVRGRSAVRRYESNRSAARSTSIDALRAGRLSDIKSKSSFSIEPQPSKTIHRLILLRYLPAGFLARLQSGILSDPIFDDVCADMHLNFMEKSENAIGLDEFIGNKAGWTCWQSGISLALQKESTINCNDSKPENVVPMLSIQEVNTMTGETSLVKQKFKVECSQVNASHDTLSDTVNIIDNQASKWCSFDILEYSNIIQISVFNYKLRIVNDDKTVSFVESEHQSIAKLLANAVDHIDNLLEDWYPSLGTRFVHTLGGNYLVTRVIPCTSCFSGCYETNMRNSRYDSRMSRASFTIRSAQEPNKSISTMKMSSNEVSQDGKAIFCYYVEHCISNAYNIIYSQNEGTNIRKFSLNQHSTGNNLKRNNNRNLQCPKHGSIALSLLAPDIVFDDIPNCYKIDNEQIERCKLIGRGTFGFVFKGSLRSSFPMDQLSHSHQEVALKLLQPVDPGSDAEQVDIIAYKSAMSNWNREPFHSACKSYCTARREVNILQTLRHPSIVLFIGLCVKPLAIVLELATMGCLTDIFKQYKRAGIRIDQYSVQKTVLQIAKALEFMHQQKVIYRDLKAENVLVWTFPSPFATQLPGASVELKLADYGISRQALSTGIWKGFAGTINFLAPEILRHNGDEEYTEKVDCFSFGMFIYELLTLRPPFKHNESTKSHLADGGRPTLTMRDLIYPNYIVDLMSVCWSQEPHHRPTASQIVSIASSPEFMQLLDVVALKSHNINLSHAIQYNDNNLCTVDLWLSCQSFNIEILSSNQNHWTQYLQLTSGGDAALESSQMTCMCVVENSIWLCDSDMNVHVLPLSSRLNQPREFKELSYSGGESGQKVIQDEKLNRLRSFSLFLPHKNTTVQHLVYVKACNCVVLLLNNGQLWNCQLNTLSCSQLDDGSIQFKCITFSELQGLTTLEQNQEFSLYCGQTNGISRLEVKDGTIIRQSIFPLANKSVDSSGERIIESSQQNAEITFIVASKDLIWTSAGCTVHLWSLDKRSVIRKLDCWKLVPCSESLESINIESYYQQARSSVVSSLVYLNNQLFVGTSHGCFMVVEADSLKPLIVFRPYEGNITILKPRVVGENPEEEGANYIVTIGSGFRDLMKRYVSSMNESEVEDTNEVAILWSASYYNL